MFSFVYASALITKRLCNGFLVLYDFGEQIKVFHLEQTEL